VWPNVRSKSTGSDSSGNGDECVSSPSVVKEGSVRVMISKKSWASIEVSQVSLGVAFVG
jgi:hypothetical protein